MHYNLSGTLNLITSYAVNQQDEAAFEECFVFGKSGDFFLKCSFHTEKLWELFFVYKIHNLSWDQWFTINISEG